MKKIKMELEKDAVVKITSEQAKILGIDITKNEINGELLTTGPWMIPIRYKALCIDNIYTINEYGFIRTTKCVIYGKRTLFDIRQTGYELEGRVSIESKKYTAFTSSQLFEVNEKLINVATIQVRKTPMPEN